MVSNAAKMAAPPEGHIRVKTAVVGVVKTGDVTANHFRYVPLKASATASRERGQAIILPAPPFVPPPASVPASYDHSSAADVDVLPGHEPRCLKREQ